MRGNLPIIVKFYQTGKDGYESFSYTAKSDGTEAYHGGVTFKSGVWHKIRYEMEKTEEGNWQIDLFIDGEYKARETLSGSSGIPYVVYETRYGQTGKVDNDGDGIKETTVILNCTDISFDIDNVYSEVH